MWVGSISSVTRIFIFETSFSPIGCVSPFCCFIVHCVLARCVDTMCCHVHDFVHNKNHTDETSATPTSIWAILLVVCRLLPPNHLIPTENFFLFLFSRWEVVCLCIHWVVQNTKQPPFLIHAVVFRLSAICLFFSFASWSKQLSCPRNPPSSPKFHEGNGFCCLHCYWFFHYSLFTQNKKL